MAENATAELVKYLTEAHAMEKQALTLLKAGVVMLEDEELASIYRAHELQTEEHERYVAERLQAHGESPSKLKDLAMQAGALGIGVVAQASPDTPIRLATTAYAFEHLEIAAYSLIRDLARRAGDEDTVAVAERILEQEEAAAELIAETFARTLELALGEPARSPLPPVTPLGKPSERSVGVGEHPGPQASKGTSPDEPVDQPPGVETPTSGEHLAHPEPGYPAGETTPYREDAEAGHVGSTARE
jgi:ferritin-like metal-binding protein YciE